ncbi:MAG TPA: alpha/beta hydrolase domain-containing protein [Amycolatopsis sp.]|nr:alpha/beta hydrolase domain-containing protein [Amycolatopsis sp.]HKS49729.1 alpha/beta hydrolase domain-containing protein [Amycolatopsis sp.]
MSGQATTYEQSGSRGSDGVWNTRMAGTGNGYTARIVVVRPNDPEKFSGTVVAEWLNVSFNVDVPEDFFQSCQHFVRSGYAYVGVTVQKAGADRLKSEVSARYSAVNFTDDTVLRHLLVGGPGRAHTSKTARRAHPGGRAGDRSFAVGPPADHLRRRDPAEGQRLQRHHDPRPRPSAAPVGTELIPPLTAMIWQDLAVPVFEIQSETEIAFASSVRQNTAKVWEVAGTAHAEQFGLNLHNMVNARDKSINDGASVSCDKPVSSMAFRYAQNAGFFYLDRWARGGAAPPAAPDISTLLGPVILWGADGNALGGMRLPDLDVPVAAYAPNNSGGNVFGACLLLATTMPFPADRIRQLYPDHATYVAKFMVAANAARMAGYLLPADHTEAV